MSLISILGGRFTNSNVALQRNAIKLSFPLAKDKNNYDTSISSITYQIRYVARPLYCGGTTNSSYLFIDTEDYVTTTSWKTITNIVAEAGLATSRMTTPVFETDVVVNYEIRALDGGGQEAPVLVSPYLALVANSPSSIFISQVSWQTSNAARINGLINHVGFTKPANYTSFPETTLLQTQFGFWRNDLAVIFGNLKFTFSAKYGQSESDLSQNGTVTFVGGTAPEFTLTGRDWFTNRAFSLLIRGEGISDTNTVFFKPNLKKSGILSSSSSVLDNRDDKNLVIVALVDDAPPYQIEKGGVKVNLPETHLRTVGAGSFAHGPEQKGKNGQANDGHSIALYDRHYEAGAVVPSNTPSIGFLSTTDDELGRVQIENLNGVYAIVLQGLGEDKIAFRNNVGVLEFWNPLIEAWTPLQGGGDIPPNVLALIKSGGQTIISPTAPSAENRNNGDIWLDSNNGNKQYKWSGGYWVPEGGVGTEGLANELDLRIQDAADAAEAAEALAVSKNTTYVQDSTNVPVAPTGGFKINDSWYVTNQGNKLKRWNGISWQDVLMGENSLSSDISNKINDAMNSATEAVDISTIAQEQADHAAQVAEGAKTAVEGFKITKLTATAQSMTFDANDSPKPASQTITINLAAQNTIGIPSWTATKYIGDTASDTISLPGSAYAKTLTQADWTPSTVDRIVISVSLDGQTDSVTIVKLKDGATGSNGQNAVVGWLTSEAATLPADGTGAVSDFSGANGQFKVFNGTTDVTASATFSKVSQTNCTAVISTTGVITVTAMSANSATAVFRAVYNGVTINKTLSLSKSLADMQIGGTNYLRKQTDRTINGVTINTSADGWITLNGTATAVTILTGVIVGSPHPLGDVWTLSANNPISAPTGAIRLRIMNSGSYDLDLTTINAKTTYNPLPSATATFVIRVENGITLTNFKLRPQLEKGTKATDWSPCPDDISLAISNVDGKFVNYSTTSQMDSAINQKTDGILTTVTSQTGQISGLNDRLTTAEGQIASKVSQSDFNNLQIGVRNLLFNTSFNLPINNTNWRSASATATITPDAEKGTVMKVAPSGAGYGVYQANKATEKNKNVTTSVWLKADTPTQLRIGCYRNFTTVNVTTMWQKFTTTKSNGELSEYDAIIFYANTNNTPFYIYQPKVEYGDKATDWSSAPEDIQQAITGAQASADRKSTVVRSESAASSLATYKAGDIWYRYSGTEVTGFWQHNGSVWEEQTLQGAVLTNLDAGKITTGLLDVTNRISANSIMASKLLISDTTNLLDDPGFIFETIGNDSSGYPWQSGTNTKSRWSITTDSGLKILSYAAGSGEDRIQNGRRIPAKSGDSFLLKFSAKNTVNSTINVRCYGRTADGTAVTAFGNVAIPTGTTTWTNYSSDCVVPNDATIEYINIDIQVPAGGTTGNFSFTRPQLLRRSNGELIVDGAITAEKISVTSLESIVANIGGFNIANNMLTSGSGATAVGISSSGNSDIAFWAGNSTVTSAPFRVTRAGALTSTSGNIGGFSIANDMLTSGSGATRVGISSSENSGIAFWAGNNTVTSAPFRVTRAGHLTSTSGNIGGFTLGTNTLVSGSGSSQAGMSSSTTSRAFWAGGSDPKTANFNVTHAGVLTATEVDISGKGTLTSGQIAEYQIIGNTLITQKYVGESYVDFVKLDLDSIEIGRNLYTALRGEGGVKIQPSLIHIRKSIEPGSYNETFLGAAELTLKSVYSGTPPMIYAYGSELNVIAFGGLKLNDYPIRPVVTGSYAGIGTTLPPRQIAVSGITTSSKVFIKKSNLGGAIWYSVPSYNGYFLVSTGGENSTDTSGTTYEYVVIL